MMLLLFLIYLFLFLHLQYIIFTLQSLRAYRQSNKIIHDYFIDSQYKNPKTNNPPLSISNINKYPLINDAQFLFIFDINDQMIDYKIKYSLINKSSDFNNNKQMKIQSQNKYGSFIYEFIFGGVAALISKSVASPIEVVKLRLQVQYALLEKGLIISNYEGMSDCFKKLYLQNGLYAFFKGNGTNALRFFLTQALNFSFRDLFRKIQKQKMGYSGFLANVVSGGVAGASTQLLVYPLDYARTRLANQIANRSNLNNSIHFNGLIDCIGKTYRSDGVLGLYRGFVVSCMCMVIYRGFYFGIYDSLRPYLPMKYQSNMGVTFCLGYFATIISGGLSYPLDTVRRRMMMTSGQKIKFKGTIECIKKIYSEGGVKAFFRGGAANIVGGLTGAAVFSIYDRIKVYYQKKNIDI